MIEFKNVSVVYPGGVNALNNVSLNIDEGDFVIIVGMSGAGKSTLLRTVNNLVKPTWKKENIEKNKAKGYPTTVNNEGRGFLGTLIVIP